MRSRKLGHSGPVVSSLGQGCMGLTGTYGPIDEQQASAIVHKAIDLGITLFDTAQVYGPFVNEEFLGKALKGRRDDVLLATKFGYRFTRKAGAGTAFFTDRVLDGSPKNLFDSIEGSLKRLQTDHIDILYQHRPDPHVPVEETAGAVARLIEQGKVRFFGLSEASTDTIRRAHSVHPVTVLQSEYSLWNRDVEAEIVPTLVELDIALVPFCPLGRGFLAGQARLAHEYPESDYRRLDPRFAPGNFERNMALVRRVETIAQRKGCSAAQLALAWLLHRGDFIVPIPGADEVLHVVENAAAAEIVLTEADLNEIDNATPPGAVSGEAWPEAWAKNLDRGLNQ